MEPRHPLTWPGALSPRQICHAVLENEPEGSNRQNKFLTEVGWREFSYHLLYHYPTITDQPRPKYQSFPWLNDPDTLDKWKLQHWLPYGGCRYAAAL